MKIETKLAIWEAANEARRSAGLNDLVFADFQAFLRDFANLAIDFDAIVSDELATKEPEYFAKYVVGGR